MKKIISTAGGTVLVSVAIMMFLALALIASGCAASAAGAQYTLTISAAASLQNPLSEIGKLYGDYDSNVVIVFNFGGSGSLQQQIEQGAPTDLFISAGAVQMNTLEKNDLIIAESRIDLLYNSLVLASSINSEIIFDSFEELNFADFDYLAIGNPKIVPAGFYARQALNSYELMDLLENKLIFAKDVREVAAWLENGNADLGILFATDVYERSDLEIIAEIPAEKHDRIVYPAAVISSTDYVQQSQQFLDFLKSDIGKEVFMRYGFEMN